MQKSYVWKEMQFFISSQLKFDCLKQPAKFCKFNDKRDKNSYTHTHTKKKIKVRNLAGHGGQAYNSRVQKTRGGRSRIEVA